MLLTFEYRDRNCVINANLVQFKKIYYNNIFYLLVDALHVFSYNNCGPYKIKSERRLALRL